MYIIICGRDTALACPPVCPVRALTQNKKTERRPKLAWTLAQGRSDWCANVQYKKV